MVTSDTLTLKKLFLVKQIYQRAILNSNSSNSAEKMISVILFDLSTETLLNTVITSLDSTRTPADKFPSLLQQTDDLLSSNNLEILPDRANIKRVHDIRNDAQHDARDPSENELSDCATYTRDFLRNVTKQVWNMDFQEIRLTDLIKNDKIKNYLEIAENSIENSDYKKTVENSCTAFEKTLLMVEKAIVGHAPYFDNQIVVTDAFGRDFKPSSEYSDSIEKMRSTLSILALNLNYMDYLKFKQITGYPIWTIGSEEPNDFHNQKENLGNNDAEFVLSFAINGVINIESTVGDLERPFGIEGIF